MVRLLTFLLLSCFLLCLFVEPPEPSWDVLLQELATPIITARLKAQGQEFPKDFWSKVYNKDADFKARRGIWAFFTPKMLGEINAAVGVKYGEAMSDRAAWLAEYKPEALELEGGIIKGGETGGAAKATAAKKKIPTVSTLMMCAEGKKMFEKMAKAVPPEDEPSRVREHAHTQSSAHPFQPFVLVRTICLLLFRLNHFVRLLFVVCSGVRGCQRIRGSPRHHGRSV